MFVRQAIWKITVSGERIPTQEFTSARPATLSDALKVVGVIIESDESLPSKVNDFTFTVQAVPDRTGKEQP